MELLDLKGIGPSVIEKLGKLGISDAESLLYHFPTRYIDRRKNLKVFDLKFIEDENYHCVAEIKDIKKIRVRGRMDFTTSTFVDDTGYINVTWFNNPYVSSQYKAGDKIIFSGKIVKSKVSNPKIKLVNNEDDIDNFARIEPIYPETRGLKSYQLSKYIYDVLMHLRLRSYEIQYKGKKALKKRDDLVKTNLEEFIIDEKLPDEVLSAENLLDLKKALSIIHFPQNDTDLKRARERLGFDEIYRILVEVSKRKKIIQAKPTYPVRINETAHELLLNQINFKLTESQNHSIEEIFADLSANFPMHRLLNGDVGSGKTVVAVSAAWQVVNNGLQVVILAPTGVLAKQHFDTFSELFRKDNIPIHLITSDTRKNVESLKQEIEKADDNNQIFIGTHALLYHLELFKKIGLLVIDEQHKFGVKQRELLSQLTSNKNENISSTEKKLTNKKLSKSEELALKIERSSLELEKVPHVLSMSATPIPRSLALTLFGDLQVSFLEKPQERKKIITKNIIDEDLAERMYEWIEQDVKENKSQVYVVCPLIEDSEKLEVKSVNQEYERLKVIFPELKIEMLHGKMKQKEKDQKLLDFKSGVFDILVSTSVIEVGIDNPNATIMIVEGAERFGLAQLHQIRGRVGRSDKQSYCFLRPSVNFPNPRIEYFASTNDGFKVAEYDLKQRGPGEVYGEAQSGIPDLKIANILDLELIKRVKKYI